MRYLHLTSANDLPDIGPTGAHKAVVIAEQTVDKAAREKISRWLVNSGCLYAMTWGEECRAWQDEINLANLQAHGFSKIPDDRLVIATSHPEEQLAEVFWFARYTAMHPCHKLTRVILLHLSEHDKKADLIAAFDAV